MKEPSNAVRELTWAEFDERIQALALRVAKRARPEAVVGVAHGGVFVGGALARALGCDFFPVRISRRSRDVVVRKRPKMTGQMPRELKGKRVLVVDDVASSGDTLALAVRQLRKIGARSIHTACLVAKPRGYRPDWVALPSGGVWVFPWDYQPVSEDARFDVES